MVTCSEQLIPQPVRAWPAARELKGRAMRRYGRKTAWHPRGHAEDPAQCIAEVDSADGWNKHQCYRNRGHGPDGLYCKQHAKMLAAGRHVRVPKEE